MMVANIIYSKLPKICLFIFKIHNCPVTIMLMVMPVVKGSDVNVNNN